MRQSSAREDPGPFFTRDNSMCQNSNSFKRMANFHFWYKPLKLLFYKCIPIMV
jgi:hypothetical protein